MPRILTLALALSLAGGGRALADGDDQPIPYPDEDDKPRELPRRSDPDRRRDETEVEKDDRAKMMGRFDDPNVGFAAELVAGLMLIESSKGAGSNFQFAGGLRATWEFGRLLPDEFWHEALFADVNWTYATLHDGTDGINGDSNYHYFTVAPAFTLPFGPKSAFGVYGQLGGGFAYQSDFIHVATASTQVSGVKPLLQYGVGLRGRPALNTEGTFRLSFRVELTRFRRGYLDDTFVAGSIGADF